MKKIGRKRLKALGLGSATLTTVSVVGTTVLACSAEDTKSLNADKFLKRENFVSTGESGNGSLKVKENSELSILLTKNFYLVYVPSIYNEEFNKESTIPPTNLAVGDKIFIEIKSVDSSFEISGKNHFEFIWGVQKQEFDPNAILRNENFSISGENGSGILEIKQSPPEGIVVEYSLNSNEFSETIPQSLSNGNQIIIKLIIKDVERYIFSEIMNRLEITVADLEERKVEVINPEIYINESNFTFSGSTQIGVIEAVQAAPEGTKYMYKKGSGEWTDISLTGLSNGDIVSIKLAITDNLSYSLDPSKNNEVTLTVENLIIGPDYPTLQEKYKIEDYQGESADINTNFVSNVSGINDDTTADLPAPDTSIDYTKQAFVPWVDNGFSWQQFIGSASEGGSGFGDYVIDNILNQDSKLVNLGFIVANSSQPATGTISNNFKTWANGAPNNTIPSIGGVLPLWMSKWTDGWGAADPSKHESASPTFEFLKKIREAGYDYQYSFGGSNNDSLAMDASLKGYSAQQLKELYAAVIDYFDLKKVDFDIEGTESGVADDNGLNHSTEEGKAAKKLRMQALKLLKEDDKYKYLHIKLTFPTKLGNISDDDLLIAKQALSYKIVDDINLMAFDYGLTFGNRITLPGETAIYAMSSINALAAEIKKLGFLEPYSKIGVVNMLGVTDKTKEVWTITDQQLFTNFAIEKGLSDLAYWEASQDTQDLIYNAVDAEGNNSLREGHDFNRWTIDEMIGKKRTKDAYSNGLHTRNGAYADIAKRFNSKTMYDFGSDIEKNDFAIPTVLWREIVNMGIIDITDINDLTGQDVLNLIRSNFIFGENQIGFGDKFTRAEVAAALQKEYDTWPNHYV